MTDRQEDDVQLSETAPREEQGQHEQTQPKPRDAATTEQGENPGDGGQHGRPSDDSDPGHS